MYMCTVHISAYFLLHSIFAFTVNIHYKCEASRHTSAYMMHIASYARNKCAHFSWNALSAFVKLSKLSPSKSYQYGVTRNCNIMMMASGPDAAEIIRASVRVTDGPHLIPRIRP